MKQLDRLLFLQGNRCFFCEGVIPEGEASVEHLVASANGGPNHDDNCVACCRTLNLFLGSLSIKAKLQAILRHRGRFACPRAARAETPAAPPFETLAIPRAVVVAPSLAPRAVRVEATAVPRIVPVGPSLVPHLAAAAITTNGAAVPVPQAVAALPTTVRAGVPRLAPASPTDAERLDLALAHLQKQRKVLPRQPATLRSSLRSTTLGRLTESELDAVIAALVRRGYVRFAADQVI